MTSIYIELPDSIYDLLAAHLENSKNDKNKLIAQAIINHLNYLNCLNQQLQRETPC